MNIMQYRFSIIYLYLAILVRVSLKNPYFLFLRFLRFSLVNRLTYNVMVSHCDILKRATNALTLSQRRDGVCVLSLSMRMCCMTTAKTRIFRNHTVPISAPRPQETDDVYFIAFAKLVL